MSLTIELGADIEEELHEQAAAAGVNAETFARESITDRLTKLRHGTTASIEQRLSAEESRLMQEINRGLSEATWKRHRELNQRRRDETISPDELSELVSLNDLIEEYRVRRLRFVGELAKLRGTTLDALMTEMQLWGPSDV